MWNKGLQYTTYQTMKASDPWDTGDIIFLWEVMAVMQGGGMWGQLWTPWTEEKARRVCRKPWQLNLVKKEYQKGNCYTERELGRYTKIYSWVFSWILISTCIWGNYSRLGNPRWNNERSRCLVIKQGLE